MTTGCAAGRQGMGVASAIDPPCMPDALPAGATVPLYDALAADYDRFVNWPERLACELPFLDGLFRAHAVRRVLDSACGTGRHAIALARRGYQVTGADLSPAMVRRAEENAVEAGVEAGFAVAGLGWLAGLSAGADGSLAPFDAVLCLGNSLPHLLAAEELAGALADFAALLRPGGLLVIQNRNFDRVVAGQQRFMDPQSHRSEEGEWLFVRFYDFHDETITFNMIRLLRRGERWVQEVHSTELWPIRRDDLAPALAEAGFGSVSFYGSYDGSAFDPAQSGDLIAVAELGNTPPQSPGFCPKRSS